MTRDDPPLTGWFSPYRDPYRRNPDAVNEVGFAGTFVSVVNGGSCERCGDEMTGHPVISHNTAYGVTDGLIVVDRGTGNVHIHDLVLTPKLRQVGWMDKHGTVEQAPKNAWQERDQSELRPVYVIEDGR